ncbi:hypothetical protein [Streptomyces sp. NPDC048272]|uniref:hypothetical protein n=1 Tax=Streptomyces sp. NPDC048272 TaxID=3154616 RepID=UPI003430F229
MSRTAHLIVAAGLTALFSAAAPLASTSLLTTSGASGLSGPAVIGWDSVRAAGALTPGATGTQVISWD